MKVRHIVAASTIGIVGVLGTAGIASAQTTPGAHNKQAVCARATSRLPKIQGRVTKIEQRIATLQTRLATAQSNNQNDRVTLIQNRIDWANTVHDHLGKVINEINTRCAT